MIALQNVSICQYQAAYDLVLNVRFYQVLGSIFIRLEAVLIGFECTVLYGSNLVVFLG